MILLIGDNKVVQLAVRSFDDFRDDTWDLSRAEVREVGVNSFVDIGGLRAVKLPCSCSVVCEKAFEKCTKLSVVEFESGNAVEVLVQHNAFRDCSELESVIFPKCDKIVIEAGAFSNCSKLRTVVFNECESVEIRSEAFSGCDKNRLTIAMVGKINAVIEQYVRENGLKYVYGKIIQSGTDENEMQTGEMQEGVNG